MSGWAVTRRNEEKRRKKATNLEKEKATVKFSKEHFFHYHLFARSYTYRSMPFLFLFEDNFIEIFKIPNELSLKKLYYFLFLKRPFELIKNNNNLLICNLFLKSYLFFLFLFALLLLYLLLPLLLLFLAVRNISLIHLRIWKFNLRRL